MILKLPHPTKKLKDMTRNVIKLLIVRPKIKNLLSWDKKFFSDIRGQQLSDVKFPIFIFFSNDFVTWETFKKHLFWSLVMLLLRKKWEKAFRCGSVQFSTITWEGAFLYAGLLHIRHFLFQDPSVPHLFLTEMSFRDETLQFWGRMVAQKISGGK